MREINVTLDATGDVTTSHITAGGLIDATGASLTLGNLSANSIALTTTVADLTVGNVTIPGGLTLTTAGDLVFGDLSAFDVDLAATVSITAAPSTAGPTLPRSPEPSIDVGNINAGGFGSVVTLDAGDDLSFDDLNAFVVNLTAGGAINGGNIDSDTNITASAGTGITFLDLEAGGFDDSEGFWDGSVDLTAGGNVETGGIVAEGAVTIDAEVRSKPSTSTLGMRSRPAPEARRRSTASGRRRTSPWRRTTSTSARPAASAAGFRPGPLILDQRHPGADRQRADG